jgi:hypothetical protein
MARRPVGIVLDASGLITICDDGTLCTYLLCAQRVASAGLDPRLSRQQEGGGERREQGEA